MRRETGTDQSYLVGRATDGGSVARLFAGATSERFAHPGSRRARYSVARNTYLASTGNRTSAPPDEAASR